MLALVPVFVTERYRLAAVPGLLICAVLGVWLLWRALAQRQWVLVIGYLLLLPVSTMLASIQKGDPESWALKHYSLGIRTLSLAEKAVAARDIELAKYEYARSQQELEAAFAYTPASTEINLAMGNLCLSKGDRPRAALFYKRVLAINPLHVSAMNNLGVLALENQQWQAASQIFSRILELDTASAKAHFLLGKARLGTGDVAGARVAVESAIRLQPNQKQFLQFREELDSQL
jgi:tetratricopeptide (TPR) repeat protein